MQRGQLSQFCSLTDLDKLPFIDHRHYKLVFSVITEYLYLSITERTWCNFRRATFWMSINSLYIFLPITSDCASTSKIYEFIIDMEENKDMESSLTSVDSNQTDCSFLVLVKLQPDTTKAWIATLIVVRYSCLTFVYHSQILISRYFQHKTRVKLTGRY